MVVNHHQRSLGEPRVHPAGRVGENEDLDAEQTEDSNSEGHGPELVPLVGVATAGKRGDSAAAHRANHQPPLVADHMRGRPVGQLAVRHRDAAFE